MGQKATGKGFIHPTQSDLHKDAPVFSILLSIHVVIIIFIIILDDDQFNMIHSS